MSEEPDYNHLTTREQAEVMKPSAGDFERAGRLVLSAHVGEEVRKLHPVTALCRAYEMGVLDSHELHVLAARWERENRGRGRS